MTCAFFLQLATCSWAQMRRTHCSWPFLHNFRHTEFLRALPRALCIISTDFLSRVLWKAWRGTKLQGSPAVTGRWRVDDSTWGSRRNSLRAQLVGQLEKRLLEKSLKQRELVNSLTASYRHYPGARDPQEVVYCPENIIFSAPSIF